MIVKGGKAKLVVTKAVKAGLLVAEVARVRLSITRAIIKIVVVCRNHLASVTRV